MATLGAFLLLVPVAIRFKAARRSLVAAIVSGLFFFYYYDMRVLFYSLVYNSVDIKIRTVKTFPQPSDYVI